MFDSPIADPTRPAGAPLSRSAAALATTALVIGVQSALLWLRANGIVAVGDAPGLLVALASAPLVLVVGLGAQATPALALLALASCLISTAAVVPLARWRSERALAAWLESEDLAEIERQHGYSRSEIADYPQVSRPPGDASPWIARESDRARATAPLAGDARGAIVHVLAERAYVLDEANSHLGVRLARTHDEIAWIALVQRSAPLAYGYTDGHSSSADRVDVRLCDREAGAVVARATIGAVPPPQTTVVMARIHVPAATVAEVVLSMLDDDGVAAPLEAPRWDREGCELPSAWNEVGHASSDACLEGATEACDRACRGGDPRACLDAGHTLDHASAARARPYFALGCRAGSASACTNFGAGLYTEHGDDVAALACARRVFEGTCGVGEYFGCGMLGRMLARGEGGDEDDARARTLLAAGCDGGNGFSCEALGLALLRSELEPVEPGETSARLRRACELGRPAACREPAP